MLAPGGPQEITRRADRQGKANPEEFSGRDPRSLEFASKAVGPFVDYPLARKLAVFRS